MCVIGRRSVWVHTVVLLLCSVRQPYNIIYIWVLVFGGGVGGVLEECPQQRLSTMADDREPLSCEEKVLLADHRWYYFYYRHRYN